MASAELQERLRFLLVHGYPGLDVEPRPRGEFGIAALGEVWIDESPKVGYGIVRAQAGTRPIQRFEFMLGDEPSLQWAVGAAIAHLQHPDEPLADASPMTRP